MFRPKIKIFIFLTLFLFPLAGQAAGFLDSPSLACISSGQCGLADIATGFVELIRVLLGLMGAIALFYFVWGGIIWITSGGNMEKVSRGRHMMVNTVLAILVAFSSYLILSFFLNDLLGADTESAVTSECSQTSSNGRVCNKSQDNYQCYNGSCLTKCEIASRKINSGINISGIVYPRNYSFACEQLTAAEVSTVYNMAGYCPGTTGDNFLCVLRDARGQRVPAGTPFPPPAP